MDCNISLKRGYQIAEAIGLRKAGFGFEDPDLPAYAGRMRGSPSAAALAAL